MTRALVLSLALASAGCPSDPEPSSAAPETREDAPRAPRGETGTVVGVVRLAEGATLPEVRIGASGSATEPAPECPPIGPRDRTPVYAVDGKLVNVLVSATGDPAKFFAALPAREPAEVELVIGKDCRLTPRLLAAVEGDTLILKNRSPIPLLPFVGRQGYVESLSVAESRRIPLEERGVKAAGCGVRGYCGSADVITIPHPVFGVTGPEGRFVIDEVPAGQEIVLHAWHPLFEETTKKVRVRKGERVEVELVIEPARRVAAPAE